MAAYEVLAQNQFNTTLFEETSDFIAYKPKKSFLPSDKIKKILKSVRKFFKKTNKVSPIQEFNGDASILEILPNAHQEPTVAIDFFSDEEYQNMENERLEAQMARR